MNIELLYLYIGENNTPVKNIDICFSHKYRIKYTRKKLEIKKQEDYQYEYFYGKYIKSCSLIVGKNGSGKTTLLNFLGMLSDNLNMYYNLKETRKSKNFSSNKKFDCNDFGCWFAVYIIDEKFYIEGFNYERLFGQKYLNKELISMNFSIFIEYDFDKNIMKLKKFSNHYLTPSIDFYYYKRLPESKISNFESPNTSNIHHQDRAGQDYTVRLNRREITCANVNNIYFLLKSYNNLLFEEKFGENSRIVFEINEVNYEFSKQFIETPEAETKSCKREKIEVSSKESFISNLYFSLAFGLWNAYFRVKDNEKDDILKDIRNSLTKSNNVDRDLALFYLKTIKKKINGEIPDYVKILDEFVKRIKRLDEKYFSNGSIIEIPLKDHSLIVQSILDYYCCLSEEESMEQIVILKYKNLSTGEHEYIDMFGSIIKILSEIESTDDCKNRVLLLDEPDRTFHPEWTSNYIYKLMKILNQFGEKKGISFQVIITTHSPFMVADVLKEDIYIIKIKDGSRIICNSDFGFASNYYDIMKDSFFLSNSVGEFAKEKIEDINVQIKNAKNVNELLDLKKYIRIIGDDYLKTILDINCRNKLKEFKSSENKALIKEKILEKEKELRILKELYTDHE